MSNRNYSLLIFFVFAVIYTIGSFDKVPFGDCIGFVLTTEYGEFVKSATATSHFLYINAAVLIKKLFQTDGISANRILVILSAAGTVTALFHTALLITKKTWIAIVASFVFGFSFTFWRNAEIVEVYTFFGFWITLFLYSALKPFFSDGSKPGAIIWSGIFLSCALLTHIQGIFLIPTFFVLLYYLRKHRMAVIAGTGILVCTFLAIIALNTWENLPFNSFYSSGHGDWVANSFRKNPTEYLQDLIKAGAYLIYNFNIFVIAGIIGTIVLYAKHRKVFWIVAPLAVLNFGFGTFYAVSDNYIFFLPFNILFAVGIAFGLTQLPKQTKLRQLSFLVLLTPLLYFAAFTIASGSEKSQNFRIQKAYKGGLTYYLLPWMNNNVGIIEFTMDKKTAPEPIHWMTRIAEEYIVLHKAKGKTDGEIREL